MFPKSAKLIFKISILTAFPFACISQDEAADAKPADAAIEQQDNTRSQKESGNAPASDIPTILENEDQHRIKQMDDAIDKAVPALRELNDHLALIATEYDKTVKDIAEDNAVTTEILSKYKPLIEQMLKQLSIVAEKEKSVRTGTRTSDLILKQRDRLERILGKCDHSNEEKEKGLCKCVNLENVLSNAEDNDLEQLSRGKIDQILNEIKDTLQPIRDNPQAPSPDDTAQNEEQIGKALAIIQDLSSEIDKTITKDQYVLDYMDQKRDERRKTAWIKALKAFSETIQKTKTAVSESDKALQPLASENVEHLKSRIFERSIILRKRVARIIWQYAERYFAQSRFNDAKDAWETSRKLFADISLDIARFQEKLNMKSPRLAEMARNSDKEVEIIVSMEEKCEKQIAATEFREQTSLLNIDSGRDLRLNDVDVNLKQAEILIRNQEYMRARDALETVLMRDPYNIKATRMLKNLYETLHDSARVRRYNEYLETLVINEWNWNEAVLPRPADKPVEDLITKQADRSSIASKLNDIVIPRIEFEDTSLNSVVQYLIGESKDNDTSPEKTGVPITLHLNADQMEQIPKITISLDDMPVGEVIRYVCQSTGLKYRVGDRAVIISTEITTVMETRFFKVRGTIINSIAPATAGEGEDMMAADADILDVATFGEAEEGATRPASVSSEQLKAYFTERGVPFTDADSTIAYDRRSGKLIVKNTPENLRRLETLLREIDIETPLVLIEAKFVELTQVDLEELGFEYLFSKDINNAAGLDDTSSWQVTQNASTMRTLGTNASGIVSPVSAVNSRLINNLQWPANFGPGDAGRYNLSFYLHAINRSQATEVLSAPKVIAASGTEAVIRMVREEYYPDSWSEPEITVTENVFRIIPSIPEFGEATDVGIRFSVTPTVSPNNYTISLSIHPEVIQRTGWSDYSYQLVSDNNVTTGTLIMRELSRRDVTTNVKVYDGETLIVGGMIRDDVSAVDDRIPGFGDVPLLGRLARTTNEQVTKRNLIIFITARLVNPDCIPIRAGQTRGTFDFRR